MASARSRPISRRRERASWPSRCRREHSIALRKPRSVALPGGIVALGAVAAAAVALHLGPQLVERPRTESGYLLPDHLERHPDRTLAALAADPRITFGLKLGDVAGVGHASIKAWSDTLGNRQYRPRRSIGEKHKVCLVIAGSCWALL
jgi:hypothetical protein